MPNRQTPQPAVRGILFDWNGTLLDDLPHAYRGWMACFALLGVPKITLIQFRRTYRLPWQAFYRDHGVRRARLGQVGKKLDATYRRHQHGVSLTRGAKMLIRDLHRQGVRLGILSDDPEREIIRRLKREGLRRYFSFIGTSETYAPKPSPAGVRAFVRSQRLKPAETLFIGDLADDIRAGRAAGVRSVAYLGGWQDAATLRRSNPDLVVRRLNHLRALSSDRATKFGPRNR